MSSSHIIIPCIIILHHHSVSSFHIIFSYHHPVSWSHNQYILTIFHSRVSVTTSQFPWSVLSSRRCPSRWEISILDPRILCASKHRDSSLPQAQSGIYCPRYTIAVYGLIHMTMRKDFINLSLQHNYCSTTCTEFTSSPHLSLSILGHIYFERPKG